MSNTVQVLTRAQEKLAKPDGWQQHLMANQDMTSFCTVGAVVAAAEELHQHGLGDMYAPAHNALCTAIREMYSGFELCSLPGWNDAPGRTQEEVVDVFDRAIKIAERDEL